MDNFRGDFADIPWNKRYIINLLDLRKIFESTCRLAAGKKFKKEFLTLREQFNKEEQDDIMIQQEELRKWIYDLYQKYKILLPDFLPDPHSYFLLLEFTFFPQHPRMKEFLQLYYDYMLIQIEIEVFLMDAQVRRGEQSFIEKKRRIEDVQR